jgi:hypothetical protein
MFTDGPREDLAAAQNRIQVRVESTRGILHDPV